MGFLKTSLKLCTETFEKGQNAGVVTFEQIYEMSESDLTNAETK